MVDYTPTLMPLPATAQGNMVTTPDALRAQREYAKALLYGSGQQPVKHWTQGVSNMVSALMGGQANYNATQQEMAARQNAAGAENPLNAQAPTSGAAPLSFTGGPTSEGQQNSGDVGDMAARKAAIATIESGSPEGNYSALGPVVKTGAYAGDRAYGKYQVMGKNIPAWTKEVLGQPMTPEQFVNSPKAQEAIFEAKSTSDPRDWFGHGKSDGYMSGSTYEKKYAEGLRKYGGDQPAMAFSGDSAGASAPAAAAVTAAALRGQPPQFAENTQVAAGGAKGPGFGVREMPTPNGSGIFIDPNLVRPKVQYSKPQMNQILASPWISDPEKAAMRQEAINQNQPMAIPYLDGTVLIDPHDPRRQQYITGGKWITQKMGDTETQVFVHQDPKSGQTIMAPVAPMATPGPRSDAGPTATPSAAPQGGPAAAPAPVQAAAQNVPMPAPRPPEAGPAANAVAAAAPAGASPAPVQVASLDPTAGVAEAAAKQPLTPTEQQMMAMVKPDAPAPATPAAVPAAPTAPEVPTPEKVAANAPQPSVAPLAGAMQAHIPGFSDEMVNAYRQNKEYLNSLEVKKASDIKNNELSAKRYEDLMGQVSASTDQRNNLATARALMNEKRFYAGLGSGTVESWQKLKVALGIDPDAAAPMEVFKKTTAQSIMAGLKSAFQGMGQIRVAEIKLQELANASLNNSPTAIKALLEISDRNAAKVQQIGEIASQYRLGGEVVDPITGDRLLAASDGPRTGLDAGYDKLVHKFQADHPTFTKAEYENFADTLKGKAPEGEAGKGKAAISEPPAGAIKDLQGNPALRDAFEKHWPGQADKYLKPAPPTAPTSK